MAYIICLKLSTWHLCHFCHSHLHYRIAAWKISQDQRSCHRSPEVFYKKDVLKIFVKFTGKHLHQNFLFNKFAGLRRASLLQNRLRHRYFPVNFTEILRTSFLQNTSGQLLLKPIWKQVQYVAFIQASKYLNASISTVSSDAA